MSEPSVNVGQELVSRLKALNDRLEAQAALLRLTDAECDDLRMWSAECVRQASTATEGANVELAERWNERAKRAAAMIERQILKVRNLADG